MGNDEFLKSRGSGQHKKDSEEKKEQRKFISAMIPRDRRVETNMSIYREYLSLSVRDLAILHTKKIDQL